MEFQTPANRRPGRARPRQDRRQAARVPRGLALMEPRPREAGTASGKKRARKPGAASTAADIALMSGSILARAEEPRPRRAKGSGSCTYCGQ